MPKVTLVLTVLNESQSIHSLLDSIAVQTRRPDEIIACDGGSRDDTVAILCAETRFTIQVIEAPGANISRGRNLAIAAASHGIIACTDAGVRLDERWLEKLVEPFSILDFGFWIDSTRKVSTFNRQSKIENRKSVVAGFFLPNPRTTFEVALSATVMPVLEDIRVEKFLPSSRSIAFLKSAWEVVGGYPEWLDYCEDLIFDLKLRERCGPFAFAPDAIAYFRPRGSLRSFFKQYYLYSRGDGKASLFFKRHVLRYGTYLVALPVLIAGVVTGALLIKLVCAFGLIGGVVAYTRTPYRRLGQLAVHLKPVEKLKTVAFVPIIRVVGDVAKMVGYPVGVFWRARHRKNKTAQPI